MSSNLVWRPKKKRGTLPKALKFVLDAQGFPLTMDSDDLEYLKGLRDGNVDGAQELIDIIEKHGRIELYLEC